MLKAVLFDLDQTLITWDDAEPWETYQGRRLRGVYDFVDTHLYPLTAGDADSFFAEFSRRLGQAWTEGNRTLRPPSVAAILETIIEAFGAPPGKLDMGAVMKAYNWQPAPGEAAFPDVLEVLPELHAHGVELGIVTNASLTMRFRDRELDAVGLLDLFPRCRIAAVDVGYLKPHRGIFERALDILGIVPEEAVFVGDNLEADIRGAQNAGMMAVWRMPAAPNGDTPAPDVTPDGTIATLHDLLPLLDGWYPGWRNGHTP
jgi:putative hydrolase of the HAD superfamily